MPALLILSLAAGLLIGVTCIMNRHLIKQAARFVNDAFAPERYFAHRVTSLGYLHLTRHHLIYWRGTRKRIIVLARIKRVRLMPFLLAVTDHRDHTMILPRGFTHPAYIYALLLHHRPSVRSTRP